MGLYSWCCDALAYGRWEQCLDSRCTPLQTLSLREATRSSQHLGSPPALQQNLGGLGHPRGWKQQAPCWQHPQTHPLPSCLNTPNAGLRLGGLRAASPWQGCVLLLLLVAFPRAAYRLTPPTRQICCFASQRKLPKPLVSSSRHPAGEPTRGQMLNGF